MIKFSLSLLMIIFAIYSCTDATKNNNSLPPRLVQISSDGSQLKTILEEYTDSEIFYTFSSDSMIIILNRNNYKIIDLNGNLLEQSDLGINIHSSCISFDRKKLCLSGYSNEQQEDLFLFDLETRNLTNITNSPGLCEINPSFSYNGDQITYFVYSIFYNAIKMINITSYISIFVEIDSLGHKLQIRQSPCFSGDDSSIYYTNFFIPEYCNSYHADIISFALEDPFKSIHVKDISSEINYKSVPSTKKLIYVNNQNQKIELLDSANGSLIELGYSYLGPTKIEVSNQGNKSIYGFGLAANEPIVLINIDGSGRVILADGYAGVFSQDGSFVVFLTQKK